MTTITTQQIETIRAEAIRTGDPVIVSVCDKALRGIGWALAECQRDITRCTCGANCNIGRRIELGLPAFCRIERAPVGGPSSDLAHHAAKLTDGTFRVGRAKPLFRQ